MTPKVKRASIVACVIIVLFTAGYRAFRAVYPQRWTRMTTSHVAIVPPIAEDIAVYRSEIGDYRLIDEERPGHTSRPEREIYLVDVSSHEIGIPNQPDYDFIRIANTIYTRRIWPPPAPLGKADGETISVTDHTANFRLDGHEYHAAW